MAPAGRRGRVIASLALSALAGALAVTGFAPYGLWPLTLLSLALLFAACGRAPSIRRGFALGFAWGLGFFLAGASWIFVSLHDYGDMPAGLAALATLLFCAFLALFPAAASALGAAASNPTLRLLLALPLAWGVGEWVRGWIFTGFPWLAVGYTQVPDGPLAGFAPLVGAYGVGYLLALVAALLAWAAKIGRAHV